MHWESARGPQHRVLLKYLTLRAFFQRTHVRKKTALSPFIPEHLCWEESYGLSVSVYKQILLDQKGKVWSPLF